MSSSPTPVASACSVTMRSISLVRTVALSSTGRQVDHDNLGAEGCQPGRQGQTDSRGGAGDDRSPIAPLLVIEDRHGLSPVFGAPRRGAQPDRAPRVTQPAAQPNSWTAPKLLGWRKPRMWLMRTVGVV